MEMEAPGSSSSKDQERLLIRRRDEEEDGYNSNNIFSYSPCHFCRKLIQSFLKCLGLERDPSAAASPPEPEAEYEEEERMGVRMGSVRAIRRPPRPPVSSGSGGSIN